MASSPPSDHPAFDELIKRFGELTDLAGAASLLAWDERTMMPSGGAESRANQMSTLARISHERRTDEALWELCEELSQPGALEPDSLEADTVRIARRDLERARKVPVELQAELAKAASLGESAWVEAKPANDFEGFLPHLERNIALTREYAACFEPADHPYDPLLDGYEPGMPTALVSELLGQLREGLVPLVEAIAANPDAVDDSPLRGPAPAGAQEQLVRGLVGGLPLPSDTYRLDPTEHPFAATVGLGDIRITTKYIPDELSYALFSALHEAGHGMYEAGVPAEIRRGPIGSPSSLGFHESQSRLWENWVGRSRPYLRRILPDLASGIGGPLAEVDPETLYRAANKVEPSLIRVEADEVTYNLHIALRFELELELFGGSLEAKDLPEAWAERARKYLGLETPDHARGVLQDVHWAGGAFGYFPTYSLGNIIAAQLWELAAEDLGDLDELIGTGDLGQLRDWLGERIHRHGARYLPTELATKALGGPLDPAPLISHLRTKYGELYGF